MRPDRTTILLVIALLIIGLLAIRSGAVGYLLSYDCRSAAETMRINWIWDPIKGCFIQQPNGSWTPIDTQQIYQP